MKEITVWWRVKKVKDGDVEKEIIVHNHIEEGWVPNDKPSPINPKFELQKAWKDYRWIKAYAYLMPNNIVIT